jgi:hypothetical protein
MQLFCLVFFFVGGGGGVVLKMVFFTEDKALIMKEGYFCSAFSNPGILYFHYEVFL